MGNRKSRNKNPKIGRQAAEKTFQTNICTVLLGNKKSTNKNPKRERQATVQSLLETGNVETTMSKWEEKQLYSNFWKQEIKTQNPKL